MVGGWIRFKLEVLCAQLSQHIAPPAGCLMDESISKTFVTLKKRRYKLIFWGITQTVTQEYGEKGTF